MRLRRLCLAIKRKIATAAGVLHGVRGADGIAKQVAQQQGSNSAMGRDQDCVGRIRLCQASNGGHNSPLRIGGFFPPSDTNLRIGECGLTDDSVLGFGKIAGR